ncbi:hypothetical protein HDV05_006246, partial [Chytridiales sp. JEL 0842]
MTSEGCYNVAAAYFPQTTFTSASQCISYCTSQSALLGPFIGYTRQSTLDDQGI